MPFLATCEKCGHQEEGDCSTDNSYLAQEGIVHKHSCGGNFKVEATSIHGDAPTTGLPWHNSEEVVVFQKPDGTYSFPMSNSKPTPKGWTRLVARTDRELAALESRTHTLNERRWFDGSGRGFDSTYRGRNFDS